MTTFAGSGKPLTDRAIALGLPVFPCSADRKPVGALAPRGFKDATSDPEAIRRWFAEPEATHIGVPTGSPTGWVTIDVDVKHGPAGMAWYTDHLEALPATRIHRTQTGGLHLIFRAPVGVEIRNSAGRLAPGVDVRAEGGYIIYPPSPGYEVLDDAEPAEMPDWLVDACVRRPPMPQPTHPPSFADADGTRYGLAALERECEAVRNAPDGQKHHTLNKAAYSIAGLVAAGELAEGPARAALRNALFAIRHRCDDPRQAERTMNQGWEAGLGKPRHVPRDGAAREKTGRRSGEEPGEDSDLPLLWFEDIKPVLDAKDFVQGVLTERSGVVVYGESNAGKTFFVTDLALHVAAGKRWNDRRVDQGGVVYCVMEGVRGFQNRVAAWKEAHGLEGANLPFVAIPMALDLRSPNADVDKLIRTILHVEQKMGVKVKMIPVDTLARAMAGGNENAPEDMGALVANMTKITEATGAAVVFIHHSGKDAAKGARGHNSLRAGIDTEIEVIADDTSDGPKTATVVKQRDLAKGDVFGFTLECVVLGQNQYGEDVTTCVPRSADGQAAVQERKKRKKASPKLDEQVESWKRDIFDLFAMPNTTLKVRPMGEGPIVDAISRNAIKDWLALRGRFSVAHKEPLSSSDRTDLKRVLNALINKGIIKQHDMWVWLP